MWQAESRLVRDAIVPMAAYAATTERIKIGSGVINNWTRNAALIAATFSTLDDLAPGRTMCGLGVWWEPLATKVGVNRRKPLLAMRETVDVVRRLLAMEKVTFKGEFVQVEDIEIDIVHGDRSPKNVPIYIGATGMKMMELSGEIADGVLLNYLVSPAYNREAMEHLQARGRSRRTQYRPDRPAATGCLFAGHRSLARVGQRARACNPVPRPATAHHESERGESGLARRNRQCVDMARRGTPDPRGHEIGSRRSRSAHNGFRYARTNAARKFRSTGKRVARARCFIRLATT